MCEQVTYKLVVSYDGTNYNGWQTQADGPTVQAVIESLLDKVFKEKVNLRYPSRTDSGVHAFGQVVSFTCRSEFSAERMLKILNSQLPSDITIKSSEIVSNDFDAKKASKKRYSYHISTTPTRSPFYINRVWWIKYKMDIGVLKEALAIFVGEKDFRAFMGAGSDAKTTIRNIYSITVLEQNDEFKIVFEGNGFLKHMIRNIVGTAVEAAIGRYDVEDVKKMLESKDRRTAGITAPAYALYLEEIYYDE